MLGDGFLKMILTLAPIRDASTFPSNETLTISSNNEHHNPFYLLLACISQELLVYNLGFGLNIPHNFTEIQCLKFKEFLLYLYPQLDMIPMKILT